MVADRNKAAGDRDRDRQDEVLLVGGKTQPLEYSGGVKLDALPMFYELCSFHRLTIPLRSKKFFLLQNGKPKSRNLFSLTR